MTKYRDGFAIRPDDQALIEAAPDLYAALARVTRQLKHEHPNDEAWLEAEAVLAKAEGTQSSAAFGPWQVGVSSSVTEDNGGYKIALTDKAGQKVGEAFLKWHAGEDQAILWSVEVKGSEQGKGHGSRLLDHAIALAKEKWPRKCLEIDTIEHKLPEAIKRRGGMQPFPETPEIWRISLEDFDAVHATLAKTGATQ